ncbi:MAG TPA: ATP-binding protein [Rhodocyclaceae bacterium]|nr:ATP-binding protein [Rhodocyclaceae bacterium]
MNAPEFSYPVLKDTPSLVALALAQLAPATVEEGAAAEALWLHAQREAVPLGTFDLAQSIANWHKSPPPDDVRLHQLASAMELSSTELLAVGLALAADTDLIAGRALSWLQAPNREVYPTAGLVACLDAAHGRTMTESLALLLDGIAVASGLLRIELRGRALPDAVLSVPLPLVLALTGAEGTWPGIDFQAYADGMLPPSLQREASLRAHALANGMPALVVRSGHPREARTAASEIASALCLRPVFIQSDVPAGLGPWLIVHKALPVFCAELSAGERRKLPELIGYRGPCIVASGPDGSWELAGDTITDWRVPIPCAAERTLLWQAAGSDEELSRALGLSHRHASARIHTLARAADAQRLLRGDSALNAAHVAHAARSSSCGDLGSLAEALPEDVFDDALVLPPALRRELEALSARCLARDGLADDLGPSARARYRPGVRALMVGPSGTGKTLSASWLATRLGMPLYRVDIAAISSKYIGETEKNLGELFARAEHAEVVLLFDEADAMFGKRTDVKDSNDRFANQQTNYLLQRIESFDGIVLLTSNSRSRFDTAFTRRLDAILEFPAPGPEERRALWLAHLGEMHALAPTQLNRLAAGCDLAGGHIRNVTLAAKAIAGRGMIRADDLAQALSAEYRKLGKQMPSALFSSVGTS